MATERPSSPFRDPKAFDKFVKNAFSLSKTADPITYELLVAEGKELEGHFRGNYAEKIAMWQKEGLGRMVRIPQKTSNIDERIGDETHYQDFLYALPFTKATTLPINGALLIFSNDDENEFCVVRPMQSASPYPPEQARLDAKYLNEFNAYFAPGNVPAIHHDLELVAGEMPMKTFMKKARAFSAIVTRPVDRAEKKEVLDEVLVCARRLKFNA